MSRVVGRVTLTKVPARRAACQGFRAVEGRVARAQGPLARKSRAQAAAYAGARHAPSWFVRYSPGLIGAAFAALLPEQRRRIRDNLRLVHGERSALAEGRDVVRTFAEYAAAASPSRSARSVKRRSGLGSARRASSTWTRLSRAAAGSCS